MKRNVLASVDGSQEYRVSIAEVISPPFGLSLIRDQAASRRQSVRSEAVPQNPEHLGMLLSVLIAMRSQQI
jgi:hypothetical protein